MAADPTVIVFALFPGVTQLDFTGPHQVLSRLPGARVLEDHFAVAYGAIAVPKGKKERLAFISEFVDQASDTRLALLAT